MGFFDNLEGQAEAIAGKAGISPDQVQSISATIQAKLGDGGSQTEAIEAAAAAHGIPVEKIQEVLGHAGSSGDIMGELGGLASGFLKG
jgi:hypothetical protein